MSTGAWVPAVAEAVAALRPVPIEFVGVLDTFGESGEPDELAAKYRIDASAIVEAAMKSVERATK